VTDKNGIEMMWWKNFTMYLKNDPKDLVKNAAACHAVMRTLLGPALLHVKFKYNMYSRDKPLLFDIINILPNDAKRVKLDANSLASASANPPATPQSADTAQLDSANPQANLAPAEHHNSAAAITSGAHTTDTAAPVNNEHTHNEDDNYSKRKSARATARNTNSKS
jgi:hypothetical protein